MSFCQVVKSTIPSINVLIIATFETYKAILNLQAVLRDRSINFFFFKSANLQKMLSLNKIIKQQTISVIWWQISSNHIIDFQQQNYTVMKLAFKKHLQEYPRIQCPVVKLLRDDFFFLQSGENVTMSDIVRAKHLIEKIIVTKSMDTGRFVIICSIYLAP